MQNRQALHRILDGNDDKIHNIHKRRFQISPFFPVGFKLDSLNSTANKKSKKSQQIASWRNKNSASPDDKRKRSPSKISDDIISRAVDAYYGAKSKPITAQDFENESFSSKIIVDQMKGDLVMTRKMTLIKTSTSKNILALSNVLERVSTSDSRGNGVGSKGGHIAREAKSPGPHNGHNPPQKPHLFLATEVVVLPKPILYSKEPLIQPVWDHRFTEGKMLSPPILSEGHGGNNESVSEDSNSNNDRPFTTGKINKATLFRQEILKSRDSKRRHSASSESFLSKDKLTTNSGLDFNLVALPATSIGSLENESQKSAISFQGYSHSRRLKPQEKIPLIVIAQKLWNTLMFELRESGNDITKGELGEVHQYVAPPLDAVIVLGFICTLMDIGTSWTEAKTVLLSDCKNLCSYFAEVNPLSISHKKLRSVLRYKNVNYPPTNSSFGMVSMPMAKLTRWTMAFSNMAALIISLVDKTEALDAVHSWMSVDASSSGDQEESTTTEYLKFPTGRWEDASAFCHALSEDRELLHEWVDFDISLYHDERSLHSHNFFKDPFPEKNTSDQNKSTPASPPGSSVLDTNISPGKAEVEDKVAVEGEDNKEEKEEGEEEEEEEEEKTAFECWMEPAFTVSINKIAVNVLQADISPKDLYLSMKFTGSPWAAKTYSIVALSSFVTWDFLVESPPADMELSNDNLDKGEFHLSLYAVKGNASVDELLGLGSMPLSQSLNSVAIADNAVIEIVDIFSPKDSSSIVGMVTCFFSVVRVSGTYDSGHGRSEVSDTADLLSHLSISTTHSEDGSFPVNTPENKPSSEEVSPFADLPIQEDTADTGSHPTTTAHEISKENETAVGVQLTFDVDMLAEYKELEENDWKEKSSRERLQDLQERLHPSMSMNMITEDNESEEELQVSPETLQQFAEEMDIEQQSIDGFIFDTSNETAEYKLSDHDRSEVDAVDGENVRGVCNLDSADNTEVNVVETEENDSGQPQAQQNSELVVLPVLPSLSPAPQHEENIAVDDNSPQATTCDDDFEKEEPAQLETATTTLTLAETFPAGVQLSAHVIKVVASKIRHVELMGQNDPYILLKFNGGKWSAKTAVADSGGSEAEWGYSDSDANMRFVLSGEELANGILEAQVMDSNSFREHVQIGAGDVALSEQRGIFESIDHTYGLLRLDISLADSSGQFSGSLEIQLKLKRQF